MASGESNTHGQGPNEPHPGTQHEPGQVERRPWKVVAVEPLSMSVREVTSQELADALERHGFRVVRGEEEQEVARALALMYADRRRQTASLAAKFAHQLEVDGVGYPGSMQSFLDLRRRVEDCAGLLNREQYHHAVSTGELSYRDRTDE